MIKKLLFIFILVFPFNAYALLSTVDKFGNDTALMLHFDGSDASTTFTDSNNVPKSFTASGDAQIDTAQSVFGGASGLFDGTGDYISTADSSDFDLGSGNFTIDFRIRFNSDTTTQAIVGQWNLQTSNAGWFIQFANTNNLQFVWTNNGTTAESKAFSWDPAANTWYHVVVERNGNNLYAFVDGNQIGSTADVTGETIFNSAADLRVSSHVNATGTTIQLLNAWIDELRIVKGTFIYTASFSPQSQAYVPSLRRIIMI